MGVHRNVHFLQLKYYSVSEFWRLLQVLENNEKRAQFRNYKNETWKNCRDMKFVGRER